MRVRAPQNQGPFSVQKYCVSVGWPCRRLQVKSKRLGGGWGWEQERRTVLESMVSPDTYGAISGPAPGRTARVPALAHVLTRTYPYRRYPMRMYTWRKVSRMLSEGYWGRSERLAELALGPRLQLGLCSGSQLPDSGCGNLFGRPVRTWCSAPELRVGDACLEFAHPGVQACVV